VIRFFVWLRFRQRMPSDRMHPHLTLLAPDEQDEVLSGKSEAAWPLSRVLRIRKSSDGLYPAFYSRALNAVSLRLTVTLYVGIEHKEHSSSITASTLQADRATNNRSASQTHRSTLQGNNKTHLHYTSLLTPTPPNVSMHSTFSDRRARPFQCRHGSTCAMHCMYIPYHLHVLVDGFFRSCTFHPHKLAANPIG